MLAQMHIVDLAIVEEVELELGPGLNVLTGETGAGKSIIVEATALLRGGRMSTEMIRGGQPEAVVEALFNVSDAPWVAGALEQAGLPAAGEELLVRRVLSASGRGRVHVNGALCTVTVLRDLVGQLLDISGQHEFQLLSDRATHRQILDAYGVPAEELSAAGQAHERLRQAASDLAQSQMDDRQRSERLDFLRFQLQEIEAAALQPEEDCRLQRERQRLVRASDLLEAATQGESELYSREGAVTDRLARLHRTLEGLRHVDAPLGELAAQVDQARILAEDVALGLRRYASGIDLDPSRLEQVEQRLELIGKLGRKHGRTVAEILQRQEAMARELADLESFEQRLSGLQAALARTRQQAEEAASRLTASRLVAAERLGREVTAHLAELRMQGARLVVQLGPRPEREGDDQALCFAGRRLGPDGWDRVELYIVTNPGEEPRPLVRVASGGELSRVMLALRRVLGRHDPMTTSVFDEVDAGIGGAVADVVGRSLAEVARLRQVLCVTHLPQVAAHADHHFFVAKSAGRHRDKAQVSVRRLDEQGRIEELARMLGGQQVTEQARANARQLLQAAASPAGPGQPGPGRPEKRSSGRSRGAKGSQ